jgi:hypothetical protein
MAPVVQAVRARETDGEQYKIRESIERRIREWHTIFKLTPIGVGQWTESVVHLFAGPPDGGFSYNGMVVDRFGNFCGATVHGGTEDDGCVYKFTP